jgi:hypothetical protein
MKKTIPAALALIALSLVPSKAHAMVVADCPSVEYKQEDGSVPVEKPVLVSNMAITCGQTARVSCSSNEILTVTQDNGSSYMVICARGGRRAAPAKPASTTGRTASPRSRNQSN